MLRDHRTMLRILANALRNDRWIDDAKGPDLFAKFKYSSPAQRERASSQSLKRLSDDSQVDDKPAKRVRRHGGGVSESLLAAQ